MKFKNIFNWKFYLSIALISVSFFIYLLHYYIFQDMHHIFIYLLGDIAFIPIEVLLVTLVIHQLLNKREKNSKMNKLNMVIGTFFSEAGKELIIKMQHFIVDNEPFRKEIVLNISQNIKKRKYKSFSKDVKKAIYIISLNAEHLKNLKVFLLKKRMFLLNLLENPSLLEHDTFTELLWSVFHLTEELELIDDFDEIPEDHAFHITNDIRRVCGPLFYEWLIYIKHLNKKYPYLYSLSLRTNPFL